MKILDLLEEIQKHSGEDIEFWILDKDGNQVRKLEVFFADKHFIFGVKDDNDNLTDTIILGFQNANS